MYYLQLLILVPAPVHVGIRVGLLLLQPKEGEILPLKIEKFSY